MLLIFLYVAKLILLLLNLKLNVTEQIVKLKSKLMLKLADKA